MLPEAAATITAESTAAITAAVAVAREGGFGTYGIEIEKRGFQMSRDLTGQQFQELGLKIKALMLFFRDLSSHVCQRTTSTRVAGWENLKFGNVFPTLEQISFQDPNFGRGRFENCICPCKMDHFENCTHLF